MRRPLDGLGASDAAAVLGVSPWQTALDVFNQKTGLADPEEKLGHQQAGLDLEPAIAKMYSRQTGRRLRWVGRRIFRHPVHRFLYAHPDRLVEGEPGLVELKNSAHYWSDQVPIYYRTQAIQQMLVADREWVDLAVLMRGHRFAVYRLERDRSVEPDFVAELADFWTEHVLARIPPPMDGTPAGRRYLRAIHPQDDGTEVLATAEAEQMVDQLRSARELRDDAIQRVEALEQSIMLWMGDHSRLSGAFGRISAKRQADYDKVAWGLVAADYRRALAGVLDESQLDAIRSLHARHVQGTRRFVVTWSQGGQDD